MQSNSQVHICAECKYVVRDAVAKCSNTAYLEGKKYNISELVYGKSDLPMCVEIRQGMTCVGFDPEPKKSSLSFISRIFGGD